MCGSLTCQEDPSEEKQQPTPSILPENSMQRELERLCPWGLKELR